MSTFSQDKTNAKAKESAAPKDNATKEDINQADGENETGQKDIPQDNPNQPTETLDETQSEASDRHIASTELPVKDVTPPDSQARNTDGEEDKPKSKKSKKKADEDGDDDWETAAAKEAGDKIVAGAAAGPERDGTVRNDAGKPAYAPPGSYNAAYQGVQQDASGHVDSVGTDNSSKSGVRI